jgi:transcriptional regulator with XRE-family HTH domain
MSKPLSLRQHRERAYLSSRELAEKSGVSPATIWRVERGDFVRLRPSTVRKIAQVLAVCPTEVAEFAPEQTRTDAHRPIEQVEPTEALHRSSARSLLKHAGKWQGGDVDELLKDVHAARGKVTF